MTDIYRISFVKLLRALAEQARNDFAYEVFDAESTGERPDLEPAVVEIAVEFAEDISDAIEALQARVLEHDRIVAEKDAEIERLHDKLSVAWTVIETLRARLDTARNDALDDAARRLLRCFPNMGMIDEFADAIRALKDRNETEPEREPDNRTDNLDNRLDGEREET